jgi:adenosylcobinamide-GDP ribazoletransferase
VPGPAHRDIAALGAAAVWFPVIGLALGAVLVAVDLGVSHLFPALLSALLTVTAWKLFTGGLHLDGLADCLDGLLGHDPEERLAIMRDSRIGVFGTLGLVLFLMIDIVALSELPEGPRRRLLLAAPAVARATPACLARLFVPARGGGQGAAFARTMPRWAWVPGLALAALVAAAALGVVGLVGTAVAFAAAVGLARFLSERLGGITGDVLGAAVETAELALVLTVSAWIHARR